MSKSAQTKAWSPTARLAAFSILLLLVTTALPVACSRRQPAAPTKRPQLVIALNKGEEGTAIKQLAATYPDADVEVVELPYTNLREKLSISLSTGRATYDLVMLDDPWFPELAPYLHVMSGLPDALLNDIIPASLRLGRDPYPDGAIKALPYVGNCQLLFYRQDILSRAGIEEPPDSWEDLVSNCDVIADKLGTAGYCIRGKAGAPIVSDFLPVLWGFGGSVFDDRGDPHAVTVRSDAMKEAMAVYRKLADASPEGATAFDWSEMTASFTAGNCALQLNWPAAVKTIDESINTDSSGARVWGVAMPPGQTRPSTSMAGNWLLAIPAASERKDPARAFLVWLFEGQEQAALAGNPPTRRSVFELTSIKTDPRFFHYQVLRQALEQATPRPRTAKWNAVEEKLGEHVSAVVTGRRTIDEAIERLDRDITAIMQQ